MVFPVTISTLLHTVLTIPDSKACTNVISYELSQHILGLTLLQVPVIASGPFHCLVDKF